VVAIFSWLGSVMLLSAMFAVVDIATLAPYLGVAVISLPQALFLAGVSCLLTRPSVTAAAIASTLITTVATFAIGYALGSS
jgi:hypothetical protein